MYCTEAHSPRLPGAGPRHAVRIAWLGCLVLASVGLSGCGSTTRPPAKTPPTVVPVPGAAQPSTPVQPAPGSPQAQRPRELPAPVAARHWDEFKRQAALRIVAANPDITYITTPPDPLLAIPVLEVELNADGSVRKIEVLRYPRQARDTTQIAIDAVKRAAPYGDMRHLKKPWKFAEVFLFDDDRRFKPRTLED